MNDTTVMVKTEVIFHSEKKRRVSRMSSIKGETLSSLMRFRLLKSKGEIL